MSKHPAPTAVPVEQQADAAPASIGELLPHRPDLPPRSPWAARRTVPLGVAIAGGATYLLNVFGSGQLNLGNVGFFLVMSICAAVIILGFGGLRTSQWESTSTDVEKHPDPDVEALLQKRIDITEYARRKDAGKVS